MFDSDLLSYRLGGGSGISLPPIPKYPLSLLDETKNFWLYRGIHDDVMDKIYQLLVDSTDLGGTGALVGMEIEVEDVRHQRFVNNGELIPGWFTHTDGSLRAGIEYVSYPFSYPDLILALVSLEKWFETSLVKKPTFSWRTSVHCHLNAHDLTWGEVAKLAIIYSIFEEQLFQFASPERRNSIFCVPLTQTHIYDNIARLLHLDSFACLGVNWGWDKYAALGTYRLFDLGTLEFRQFPGEFDLTRLAVWLGFIIKLREAAKKISFPQLVGYLNTLNTLSNYHELQYLVFGDSLSKHLAIPENSIQMLSNGVTFAKKCIENPKEQSVPKGSPMYELYEHLSHAQKKLLEKYPAPAIKPNKVAQSAAQILAQLHTPPPVGGGGGNPNTPGHVFQPQPDAQDWEINYVDMEPPVSNP